MTDRPSTAIADLPHEEINRRERERERVFVLDFVEASERHRRPFAQIWDEMLDNYMVAQPGRLGGTRNLAGFRLFNDSGGGTIRARLKDSGSHENVESLASQGLGLLLGPSDYLQATPIGLDDPEKARLLSNVIMGVIESPNWFRTLYGILKDSFIFGTAIMELGWSKRGRRQVVQTPVRDPFSGELVSVESSSEFVVYEDMPSIRAVDIYDFYPDPSGTRIQQDMIGVAKRFRISVPEARNMARRGVYDERQVQMAVQFAKKRDERSSGRHDTRFSTTPDQEHEVPEETLMLTGLEYWGEVPWKPFDKAQNRVVTLLEGIHVRSTINPFIDGNIPFKEVTMNPINGRFYGLGPLEVSRFLQDSADNMLMTMTDATNMMVNGPLLVGNAFAGDLNRLKRRRFNDVIRCSNPDAVKPIPQDLSAMQLGGIEYIRRREAMKSATGSLDPQSISDGERDTATKVSEVVRLASQRLELQIQIIEKDDFPWLGRTIHSRIKQFMPSQGAVATLAGEQFPITLDDINVEADVRFVGSRQAMSKAQLFNQNNQLLQTLSQNPNIALMYPELLVRMLRDGMEMKDAEAQVAKAGEVAQQLLALEQNSTAGGSPSATDNTLNTPGSLVSREGAAVR